LGLKRASRPLRAFAGSSRPLFPPGAKYRSGWRAHDRKRAPRTRGIRCRPRDRGGRSSGRRAGPGHSAAGVAEADPLARAQPTGVQPKQRMPRACTRGRVRNRLRFPVQLCGEPSDSPDVRIATRRGRSSRARGKTACGERSTSSWWRWPSESITSGRRPWGDIGRLRRLAGQLVVDARAAADLLVDVAEAVSPRLDRAHKRARQRRRPDRSRAAGPPGTPRRDEQSHNRGRSEATTGRTAADQPSTWPGCGFGLP
jgi:hypothetical protein